MLCQEQQVLANVNVVGHLLHAIFLPSLAWMCGHSLSHNFHAQVQTHRQPLWHCGTFILLLVGVIYMSYSSHVLTYAVAYACVWTYAMPVCVLFLSCMLVIIFNPSEMAITDHSQSAKDIHPYCKSQLCVDDPSH